MEARMKKNIQFLSPERSKVWTEKSPKYQQCRKIPVVYYLCRNRKLEHPHFIEVPLLSPDGLFLRDVIERLNVLRGRGMPSMYSWSCKRSYKSGFVWHDLCEDDLILPTKGNEYVLKGTELFEESNSDRFSPVGNMKMQNPNQLQELASSRSQDESSSSSSMNGKEAKHSQDDDVSPPLQRPVSSGVSPESSVVKNSSSGGALSLIECKFRKNNGAVDASTQTEENVRMLIVRETRTRGVSREERTLEPECNEIYQNHVSRTNERSGFSQDSVSPMSSSSASSSVRKNETLESLIRADDSKINSFRILEEEDIRMPSNVKLKATNILMQLISCGSLSMKDHSFGLIPTYRPRFLQSKFASPLYSTSIMFGEFDCLSDNSRLMGLRLEDKEYFSGSLIETKLLKEDGEKCSSLKRSSSYNADRTSKQLDSVEYKEETTSGRSKCIARSIKASLGKQPRCESMRSPLSDGLDSLLSTPPCKSSGSSKRYTESAAKQSKQLQSFREEEKIIKIEERLASGARVIIQSKTACDVNGNS